MWPMDDWSLVYEDFDPAQEGHREALCTLGNGYFATRGATEESFADDTHYPGTYLAGCYNRLDTTIAGRTITNEDLVNCPNWLPLTFRVGDDDRWFNLAGADIVDYSQELNLKEAVLTRRIAIVDATGHRFRLAYRRFVHMSRQHLAAIHLTITSEDWSGPITVRSGLDGSIINAGVPRYRELNGSHLELVNCGEADNDSIFLLVRTKQSRIEIAEAARTRLFRNGDALPAEPQYVEQDGFVATEQTFNIVAGETVEIEKIAAIYTSKDHAITESTTEARRAVTDAGSFEELREEHTRAWAAIWRHADISIEVGDHEQRALRLNLFHLVHTVSANTIDLDVGVPARGLHGEAYRGHVFWDELFIFPPITGKLPDITRSLLLYRYRRLDAARRLAAEAGFRGALYPWQSGSNGDEETQLLHLNPRSGHWLPDNSRLQRHANIAIAYNVWRYFRSTNDRTFMRLYGAEMMIEIARLLDSLATFNDETQRYEITGVMGPDEYHDGYPDRDEPGLDNNAYTNIMTVWLLTMLLRWIDEIPPEVRSELTARLDLRDEETARWVDITRRMTVPFHDGGIISQFEGYDDLEEFDWDGYRDKYGDIQRLDRLLESEGDSPNRYKLSKQADVWMLFFLLQEEHLKEVLTGLGYAFDDELMLRNIEYYLARTSHGSTLSSVVHASVLARVDPERAWPLFCHALSADLQDIQGGTTREGIHLGAMAGAVDIVERSYAGIDRLNEHLRINPRLPLAVKKLNLRENFHRRWYELTFSQGRVEIGLEPDGLGPATVWVHGQDHVIKPGGKIQVDV
jgi:alpha,alpha-trehalase